MLLRLVLPRGHVVDGRPSARSHDAVVQAGPGRRQPVLQHRLLRRLLGHRLHPASLHKSQQHTQHVPLLLC
jgi:hypothetical protein